MQKNKIFLSIYFLFVLVFLGQAQIAPVQSIVKIRPPYPLYFSDFSRPENTAVSLEVRLLDASVQSSDVYLRMVLKGEGLRIETSPTYMGKIFQLRGGETLSLEASDLQSYFTTSNLVFSGISKQKYMERGTALYSGSYALSFEVYERKSGAKVSYNEVSAIYMALSLDPPLLNFPADKMEIWSDNAKAILFQWTPRHLSVAPMASLSNYDFELRELPPNFSGDRNRFFNTFPLVYRETLSSTMLNYGLNHPALIPEKTYVYRIRLLCTGPGGESLLCRNDGYTEIRSFFYKEKCPDVTSLRTEVLNQKMAILVWNEEVKIKEVEFLYRKADVKDAQWFQRIVEGGTLLQLSNLEAGQTYEGRMLSQCAFSKSTDSVEIRFTTPEEENNSIWCGSYQEEIFENKNPLYVLRAFDVVKTSSGFEFKIDEVTSGYDGVFSGKAYTYIPLFSKTGISFRFKNISVNENYELIDGEFVAEKSGKSL